MLVRLYAAMDFGSNAIRGVIAKYSPLGLEIKKKYRFPIRLGHEVFHGEPIPDGKIQNTIEIIRYFKDICLKEKVQRLVAVGTSALRDASNQQEFLETCYKTTGLKIHVIDGKTEAELIWLGVKNAVHIENHFCLLMDVGGGSVELSLNYFDQIISSHSLPWGTLRLLEQLRKKRLQEKDLFWLVREHVEAGMVKCLRHRKEEKIEFIVGTGGNFTSLLELAHRLSKKVDSPPILNRRQLYELINRLESVGPHKRAKVFDLKKDRADVIVPAAHLLLLAMDLTECNEVIIPQAGLREGVLWSLVGREKKRWA
ncbi:MAG: hypothetical protein NZ480_02400 [Bdellovibrionaceae bacterium]|nr:hypothetical protein [Pseudobdellovibrionaceae bacterium]MDW8189655.1 hypothetical protein [Pseudobdellovibrionaceae bacterium]